MQPQSTRALWNRFSKGVAAVGIGVLTLSALSSAADAGVESNEHSIPFGPVSCPSVGLTFEDVVTPTSHSRPGLVSGSNVVGVAKSLYLADAVGTPLVPLFDVRGKGLDTVTTWCYWPSAVSPTGYIGGDILFNAALRS